MTLKKTRYFSLYGLAAFAIIFITVFSFVAFERAVNRTISDSSTNFLKETASLYAGTFQVKLNDQLFMLESQARYFTDVDMDDYNAVKNAIMATKGVGEFKRIAVATSSGMTINSFGKSSGNILMKDYFKKAMKGHAQISSTISTDEDGEQVLTLAVPIFQEQGQPVGIITGTFAYSILDNIFSVDTFNGEGYSFLIDKEGRILIGSHSPRRMCFEKNWFDFLNKNKILKARDLSVIYSDMQSNRTGIANYSVNDANRIVVYTPVGMNDWYVLSVITADYILSQENKINKITITLIAVMLAVFAIITVFLTRIIIQRERLAKDNSRYAINTENSQTLIFEYDFERGMIEFTGNSDFFFGDNIKQLPISNFSLIESRIHESEKKLLSDIRNSIANQEKSFSTELRVKGYNNEYIWYRLSATISYSEANNPVKFIGNLTNVNEQVVHEQELKTMAETDLLSGLINKVYMEKNVSQFLSEHKDTHVGAFFIIDLDNFKQVNDKLGHTFGDQAICDTANKLTLVFSEKDFIGRIGGDEFCVFLCLKNTIKNPQMVVEKKAITLVEILAEDYTNGEIAVGVTPSIGISLYPEQSSSYSELFKMADSALYHVKNNGKNNYTIYNDSMKGAGESVYE